MTEAWTRAFADWLAEIGRRSPNTRKSYTTVWRRFDALILRDAEGGQIKSVWDVTRADVIRFAQALQDEGRARGTVNAYVAAVSSFYAFTVDICDPPLLARNPARGIDWLRPAHLAPVYITKAQVEKTIAAIPTSGLENLRDAALIDTLWRTGMRNSATRSIRFCDLSTRGGAVWLRYQSKGRETMRPFNAVAFERVRTYITARGLASLIDDALRGRSVDPTLYLFISHSTNSHVHGDVTRRPLRREGLSEMTMRRTLAALGVAYKPHALRHGAARHLRMAGVDIKAISEWLDHSDLATTARYLELLVEDRRDVSDVL